MTIRILGLPSAAPTHWKGDVTRYYAVTSSIQSPMGLRSPSPPHYPTQGVYVGRKRLPHEGIGSGTDRPGPDPSVVGSTSGKPGLISGISVNVIGFLAGIGLHSPVMIARAVTVQTTQVATPPVDPALNPALPGLSAPDTPSPEDPLIPGETFGDYVQAHAIDVSPVGDLTGGPQLAVDPGPEHRGTRGGVDVGGNAGGGGSGSGAGGDHEGVGGIDGGGFGGPNK